MYVYIYIYIYVYIYIYTERERETSAKFGVVVFKASMLNWPGGINLPWVYVHCSIYIYLPGQV